MVGYVRLVSSDGTIIKRVFNNPQAQNDAYNEVLKHKCLWEECAPHMFPDGLKILIDRED